MWPCSEKKPQLDCSATYLRLSSVYIWREQIQILAAGAETMLFKQFFFNWLDKDESTGPTKPFITGRIAKVDQIPFDASKLHETAAMAAQHSMVDDGSGKVQVGSLA